MSHLSKIQKTVVEKIQKFQSLSIDPVTVSSYDEWLRMELTYTSNAIEGNTLTRKETKLVVEDNISVGGKSMVELLEAKNHDNALKYVRTLATEKTIQELTAQDILQIHAFILQGIWDRDAGKYRNVPVRISGSMVVLPNHLKVDSLMNQLMSDLNTFQGDTLEAIELAIETHYRLVTIHPFVDGNGRVGRLVFNVVLLQYGLPLTFIKTEERERYISALEKAQLGGSDEDYRILMYQAIERSLDIYLTGNQEKFDTTLYKIGEIADLSDEDVSTIRYWTKLGLIDQFSQTKSGYALYQRSAVENIRNIRRLQIENRLSLEEIKKLISK